MRYLGFAVHVLQERAAVRHDEFAEGVQGGYSVAIHG